MEEKKIESLAEFGFKLPSKPFPDDFPKYEIKPCIKILSFIIVVIDLICMYLGMDSLMIDALTFAACGSLVCFFITIYADQYCRDHLIHLTNIWIGIRMMVSVIVWVCIVAAIFDAEIVMTSPKQQLVFALAPVSVVLHYFQFKSIEELNPNC